MLSGVTLVRCMCFHLRHTNIYKVHTTTKKEVHEGHAHYSQNNNINCYSYDCCYFHYYYHYYYTCHMYPIPRIISSLCVDPGGCVTVFSYACAISTLMPVRSQPHVFTPPTPYSGMATAQGSPWQPWEGALETITALLWWHSNSYHYTSSKETRREAGDREWMGRMQRKGKERGKKGKVLRKEIVNYTRLEI